MKALEITGLRKTYSTPDGERHTVVQVESLSVEQGEQVVLGGESGSGKTTLLHLIAGLLRSDAGRILIGEEDMTVSS